MPERRPEAVITGARGIGVLARPRVGDVDQAAVIERPRRAHCPLPDRPRGVMDAEATAQCRTRAVARHPGETEPRADVALRIAGPEVDRDSPAHAPPVLRVGLVAMAGGIVDEQPSDLHPVRPAL